MRHKPIENETILLKQISCGDEKAFSILFYHYLPIMSAFAMKFGRSEVAVEEILQNSFLRIWLNRDKLEYVENIKAYLYKYVSNECLRYLKKAFKETKNNESFKINQPVFSNNTLESIHRNELSQLIIEAIGHLPKQRRKIYELSRVDGKSIPEIAEILNLSPNTVKNALVTALKTIRAYLHKHDF